MSYVALSDWPYVLVQEGGGGWGRISCRVDEKWDRCVNV